MPGAAIRHQGADLDADLAAAIAEARDGIAEGRAIARCLASDPCSGPAIDGLAEWGQRLAGLRSALEAAADDRFCLGMLTAAAEGPREPARHLRAVV
jgi:hypothetical protein